METPSSRKEYFRNNLGTVDNEMKDFINLKNILLLKYKIFDIQHIDKKKMIITGRKYKWDEKCTRKRKRVQF